MSVGSVYELVVAACPLDGDEGAPTEAVKAAAYLLGYVGERLNLPDAEPSSCGVDAEAVDAFSELAVVVADLLCTLHGLELRFRRTGRVARDVAGTRTAAGALAAAATCELVGHLLECVLRRIDPEWMAEIEAPSAMGSG